MKQLGRILLKIGAVLLLAILAGTAFLYWQARQVPTGRPDYVALGSSFAADAGRGDGNGPCHRCVARFARLTVTRLLGRRRQTGRVSRVHASGGPSKRWSASFTASAGFAGICALGPGGSLERSLGATLAFSRADAHGRGDMEQDG